MQADDHLGAVEPDNSRLIAEGDENWEGAGFRVFGDDDDTPPFEDEHGMMDEYYASDSDEGDEYGDDEDDYDLADDDEDFDEDFDEDEDDDDLIVDDEF
jgi:hypothetical protein